MQSVESLLQQARDLLGTGHTAPNITFHTSARPLADKHPPSWEDASSTNAAAATTQLDTYSNRIQTAHKATNTALATASQISQQAHTRLNEVEAAWQQHKDHLSPIADPAQGKAALLQAAQQCVADATQIIEHTATEYQQLAHQVRSATANLPTDKRFDSGPSVDQNTL
jgi:hypothetical protein